MTTTVSASEALARAILAVGSDNFSETLHSWLEATCSFDNIAAIAFFQSCGPQVLMTHARDSRVFERIDSHYVKGAYMLDPFYGLHKKRATDGVYRLTEIAPDQFQRNDKVSVAFTQEQWAVLSKLAEEDKDVPAELVKLAQEALGLEAESDEDDAEDDE